jgi:hypothetical protein
MMHAFMRVVVVFIVNVSVFSNIVYKSLIHDNKSIKVLGGNENEKVITNSN